MIIFRFIALVLIVAALMVLGHDAISSLSGGGQIQMLSLEGLWGLFDTNSMTAAKDWATGVGGGAVVDTVLTWPAFAVIGVLGVLLAFLFRPRED